MLPLLLPLLWAGEQSRGPPGGSAHFPFPTGPLAQDDRYQLTVQKSVTVQEGLCISVPCAFSFPEGTWTNFLPLYGYWFRRRAKEDRDAPVATNDPHRAVQEEAQGRFHLLGDPQNYDCSLEIRDARRSDVGNYFFRIERGSIVKYSYKEKPLAVRVTGKAWATERPHGWVLRAPRAGLGCILLLLGRDPGRQDARAGLRQKQLLGAHLHPHLQGVGLCTSSPALSQTPDINIQGTLESGHPRNITCTVPWACERGTPPTFSWIGVNLTPLDLRTPHSSMVTLTPGPQHHGIRLTCRVTFHGGVSTERTIRLNVSRGQLLIPVREAPQKLMVRVFWGNSTVPEDLANATSLPVQEGQSLRLVCETNSEAPARLSWSRGSLTLNPSDPLHPGVLELCHVVSGDGGEFTCRAQHPQVFLHVSLKLVVWGVSYSYPQSCGEQQGSWPLVLTLLRGALMGAGFLLTYGLTWIYYTRFRGSHVDKAERHE
ncbi:sialic acid-binding Ig-like lectin 13 isoform X2 [Rousettus aegyptiacus]|uniref:sialic acid-binding Ig-like lectin 13 isoform X2 n=1 Tax=Rousettus aegyptiacus TaxID=9407 RepID=UPI00168D14E4|nr:sialic acid-binding Ig-like lectin 13 isoform X2 [Rousettus aegyptiacus]